MIGVYGTDWDGGWRPSDRLDLAGRAGICSAQGCVDDAVEAAGRGARRAGGKLPPHVMVYFAVALALWPITRRSPTG